MNFLGSDKKHADETPSKEGNSEALTQEMLQKHHGAADQPSELAIAKVQEIMASKEDEEEEFPPLLDSAEDNALSCSSQSERFTLYVCGEVGTHGADNSGLNILFAEDEEVCANTGELLKLSARVRMFDNVENRFVGCMIVPRSSIRKSSLILQNSVGIIDPGYQGILHAPVFNLNNFESYIAKKGESLVQVIHPTLALFNVVPVGEDHPVFAEKTERGDKGFGSTGLA